MVESGQGAAASAASPVRDVVTYLVTLRPVMARVTETRREWIRAVGLLIEESRTGDPIALSRNAGRLGRGQLPIFREARAQIGHQPPPQECRTLHDAVVEWIEQHILACEALIRAEEGRNLRPVRETQERLAEGRWHCQRFNAEYRRLVTELRERVEAALQRRRARGLRTPRARRSRSSGPLWRNLFRRLPR